MIASFACKSSSMGSVISLLCHTIKTISSIQNALKSGSGVIQFVLYAEHRSMQMKKRDSEWSMNEISRVICSWRGILVLLMLISDILML